MPYTHALVRPPSSNFADGLTSRDEGAPDIGLALKQHRTYCKALVDCGLEITTLPADPLHPDSTFVEDAAIITARGAIAMRPGAPSRTGEVESIYAALRSWYPDIPRITAPGTVDGGDVCDADGHFLIGLSARTNEEGARQLAGLLEDFGYRANTVDIRGSRTILHLKTGLSYVGDGRIVIISEVPRVEALTPYELIPVADDESYAANCIRINDRLLVAARYPKIHARLAELGYDLIALDLSEFRKMDGSLTCLSLRL